MGHISDILDNLQSNTPSNWRKCAVERILNKEVRKVSVPITLDILDSMNSQGITAEHMSHDLDIPLDELRLYLSGNVAYPLDILTKIYQYLKIVHNQEEN